MGLFEAFLIAVVLWTVFAWGSRILKRLDRIAEALENNVDYPDGIDCCPMHEVDNSRWN